jgi:hypothetical protein
MTFLQQLATRANTVERTIWNFRRMGKKMFNPLTSGENMENLFFQLVQETKILPWTGQNNW